MALIPGVTKALTTKGPDFIDTCLAAARGHKLPQDKSFTDLCLNHDPSFSPALVSVLDQSASDVKTWVALKSEDNSFSGTPDNHHDIDSAELDSARQDFGHLPLIVLTAGDQINLPGLSDAQKQALFRVWKGGHDELAARSSDGRNIVVPDSTHYIQFDQPLVVVQAITNIVTRVRENSYARTGN